MVDMITSDANTWLRCTRDSSLPDQQWCHGGLTLPLSISCGQATTGLWRSLMAFVPVTVASAALITPQGTSHSYPLQGSRQDPSHHCLPGPAGGVKEQVTGPGPVWSHGNPRNTLPGWTFYSPKQPSYWCYCLVAKSCMTLWHQAPLPPLSSGVLLKFISIEVVMLPQSILLIDALKLFSTHAYLINIEIFILF